MIKLLSFILISVGIFLVLNISPIYISEGLLNAFNPKDTLYSKSIYARSGKTGGRIYQTIQTFKRDMEMSGKGNKISIVVLFSVVAALFGMILSVVIGNVFLVPVFVIGFFLIPFIYTKISLSLYRKSVVIELETAMSIITVSYLRNENIVLSIGENISYIKPPVRQIFERFLVCTSTVSSDTKRALYELKSKNDNPIFHEWCDALIRCNDDNTLKDTLQPIVNRMADIRNANSKGSVIISSSRMEYITMALMVVFNIPLLFLINKEWFSYLVETIPGKLVCGICGGVLLITSLLCIKYTRPIQIKEENS